MIYLLTVNYYSTSLIARLIQSLPSQQKIIYQIVIVNNSPADQNLKQLESDRLEIIEAKTNLGFGQACNLGLTQIYKQDPQGIVWIINPDTYLPSNILEKVPAFFASHQEISLLGTLIYTPDNRLWFAGGRFIPQLGAIFSVDLFSSQPETDCLACDWVSGCSLLINLSRFQSCPQFDPAYFLYYEDFDFCRRYAKQGHQIAVTNRLAIIHQPSSIANRNIAIKLQHSTYSYLLTLERYTNPLIFSLRFLRLLLYSLIVLAVKPQAAFGKLVGISNYLSRFIRVER
ncbi:MAG: glycosyltransferase family 2 protein [Xenococcaceae cyanobacterium MO_188.B29]|nr:glycosyltransferase family 2 protein [Xenococcaceae cyanobacterium MO_188.B29]